MADFFLMLSLLILVVIVVSVLMRLLGQPLMVGYVISGMLVGSQLAGFAAGTDVLNAFSDLGISFLLFLVGLSLTPSIIREVGKAAFVIGAGQMVITGLFWYAISTLMGFGPTEAMYMAIALTFSSTIIVMKLLSDKDEVDKLHGSMSLSILLLQDLAAIVVIVLITPLSGGAATAQGALWTIAKGILTVIIAVPISNYLLPKLGDFFARSQEFLFLFAIGWGMGMSSLFGALGFSIEAGALLAGVMLSISPYSQEIISRLKPLRDFFIISFFLILGSRVSVSSIEAMAIPAALFIVLILIAKPLVVMLQMLAMGYGARTGFLTGISMSQISEFSLILVAIGERAGQLPHGIVALTTLVGLVTMAGSSYLIMHSEGIYSAVSGALGLAGKKARAEKTPHHADCILMGYNRIGYSILKAMDETGKECLVVDFNPATVKELAKKGVMATYGDAWDTEFLKGLRLDRAKMVVSTVPDRGANMLIASCTRKANPKAVLIVTARQISEAVELYGAGADYVILPHFLGGKYVSAMIEKDGFDRREYENERKEHLKELKERAEMGHEHPKRGG